MFKKKSYHMLYLSPCLSWFLINDNLYEHTLDLFKAFSKVEAGTFFFLASSNKLANLLLDFGSGPLSVKINVH